MPAIIEKINLGSKSSFFAIGVLPIQGHVDIYLYNLQTSPNCQPDYVNQIKVNENFQNNKSPIF